MGNERITENLVRDRLRDLGYFDPTNTIKLDEQKSAIESVTRLMKQASKAGGGGKGAPEFIISDPTDPDFLVSVECKADSKDHASPALDAILLGAHFGESEDARNKWVSRYAADGVLHYARDLSRDFSVVALAVSGQTASAQAHSEDSVW